MSLEGGTPPCEQPVKNNGLNEVVAFSTLYMPFAQATLHPQPLKRYGNPKP